MTLQRQVYFKELKLTYLSIYINLYSNKINDENGHAHVHNVFMLKGLSL